MMVGTEVNRWRRRTGKEGCERAGVLVSYLTFRVDAPIVPRSEDGIGKS